MSFLLRVALLALLLAGAATESPAASTPSEAAEPEVMLPDLPERRRLASGEKAQVEEAYERSAKSYEAGDLEGALRGADEVFELLPNASTALMRAEILAEMGRSCDATAMLLVARDLDPRPAETADIEKLLAGTGSSCGGGYGWAHVEVEPGSALVSISGVSVPNGRTVGLSVGSHTVEMETEGFAPLRMELVARSGQATAAKLELPRLPPPEPAGPAGIPDLSPADDAPAAPDVAVEAASAASGAGPIPWILLGAGAGAVVGGVGATLWAIDARSEAERWHDPESPEAAGLTADERRARYNSADDDVGKRRTVSYVLYGVGAASVAAGVAWLIFAPDGEAASAQVTPWLSPGASGISLSGAF